MAKNGISKLQLNKLVKTLPAPVQEHSKRLRKLASFFIERVSTEDWFLEAKLKGADIVSAISYHDIGKCAIPKDTIYFEHCPTNVKREKYRSHVEEGVKLIEKEFEISLTSFKENSYERTLYNVITEHHEREDGSGFPNGKTSGMLSFAGKLLAVLDTFDNLLFVGTSNKIDFDSALEELKRQSGEQLDQFIVETLTKDEDTLREFISYINNREKDRRRKDRYGIQVRYQPIVNVLDNRIDSYQTDIVINDPYYGVMQSHLFLPIAEKVGNVFQLEKIGFEKLCINLEKLSIRGLPIPEVAYRFSARHLQKKNFFKDVAKIMRKYDINPAKIYFVMTETSLTDYDGDIVQAVNGIHDLGAKFAIGEFGDQLSLISANDNLHLDAVIFKKTYGGKLATHPKTYSIVSGVMRIIEKLHIETVFDGIDDRRGEESVLKMGGKYACGNIYSAQLNDREFINFIKSGGGLDG